MFNTHYDINFKDNEKGLIECDVVITNTFFKWVTSTEKLTMIFLGEFWVDKNSMTTINDYKLVEIVTNSAIYYTEQNKTDKE